MQFILPLALSLLRLVVAQGSKPNAFALPPGFSLTAGQPTTLKWSPDTPGKVSLYLRSGASSDLDKGTLIKGQNIFFHTLNSNFAGQEEIKEN